MTRSLLASGPKLLCTPTRQRAAALLHGLPKSKGPEDQQPKPKLRRGGRPLAVKEAQQQRRDRAGPASASLEEGGREEDWASATQAARALWAAPPSHSDTPPKEEVEDPLSEQHQPLEAGQPCLRGLQPGSLTGTGREDDKGAAAPAF